MLRSMRFANSFEQDRVRELESELWRARRNIISLMPDDLSELLLGYRSCQSESEYYRWQREMIGQIVAFAKPDPEALTSRTEDIALFAAAAVQDPMIAALLFLKA
jgi:hypothetical protein